jgi:hypothetical protein
MGWNQVHQLRDHPLWQGISQDSRFYFVHSYYLATGGCRAGGGPNLVRFRLRLGDRARQPVRRAIPPGKKRPGGTAVARQFRGLEPLTSPNLNRSLLEEPAMLLIPAIDLKDGKCVRLRQGRMEDSTVFSDDPVAMAGRWVEAGARRLHLVDLNGAFAGQPVNAQVIRRIAEAFPDLPIQVGGGIRDEETVDAYLDAGVQFVIIGTKAVQEPHFINDLPGISRPHHRRPGRQGGTGRGQRLVQAVQARRG